MTPGRPELEGFVKELDSAATRLRSQDIDDDEAAALVERCAELAAAIAASLEREVREVGELPLDEPVEQERLL